MTSKTPTKRVRRDQYEDVYQAPTIRHVAPKSPLREKLRVYLDHLREQERHAPDKETCLALTASIMELSDTLRLPDLCAATLTNDARRYREAGDWAGENGREERATIYQQVGDALAGMVSDLWANGGK